MLTILSKAYCVNKHYLFQNKIYYLDKIYIYFAKMRKALQTYSRLVKKYRLYAT